MSKYRDIPMSQRLDKIGELLAKGVYLYVQKQKAEKDKAESEKQKEICESPKQDCPDIIKSV